MFRSMSKATQLCRAGVKTRNNVYEARSTWLACSRGTINARRLRSASGSKLNDSKSGDTLMRTEPRGLNEKFQEGRELGPRQTVEKEGFYAQWKKNLIRISGDNGTHPRPHPHHMPGGEPLWAKSERRRLIWSRQAPSEMDRPDQGKQMLEVERNKQMQRDLLRLEVEFKWRLKVQPDVSSKEGVLKRNDAYFYKPLKKWAYVFIEKFHKHNETSRETKTYEWNI